MHLEKLDLNLIVALETLMRLRSVSAAAEELNITQSAVSSALKRARAHFENEIFYYDGHQMVPTPFGAELENIIPQMISQLRALSRMRSHRALSDINRQFTIIASDYIAAVFLSELSKRLASEAPGITLSVIPFTDEAISRYRRGLIGFMIGPDFSIDPASRSNLLLEEQFTCLVWKNNSIVKNKLTTEAFEACPHVITNFFLADGKSHFERWLLTSGLNVKVAAALPSFVLLPYYVSGTNNIATLHKRLIPYLKGNPELSFMEPPFEIPTLREYLVYKKERQRDNEAELLRQYILTMPD